MKFMLNRKGIPLVLMILIIGILFCPKSATAETYATRGDGLTTVTFFAESEGNASITLRQSKGISHVINILGITGKDESNWGKYHITIVNPTGSTYHIEEWDKTSFGSEYKIQLPLSGKYRITIKPYTKQEMTNSWSITKEFSSWIEAPQWEIKKANRCSCSAQNPQPTQKTYSSGELTIEYYLNGEFHERESRTITSNCTIQPKSFPGYECSSSGVSVTFDKQTGICSPSSIKFQYKSKVYSGRVYVIKIDIDTGAELSTYYQTVDSSLGVIASGGVPDGYSIVGDSFQSVNVASNGTVTPNPVYFYYKKKNITPHVNTGSVYIRKIDIDTGEELSSYYETVDSSVGIVAAGLTPNGYSLACDGFCNVSVANDGTVNPSSITFYYRKDRSNSNYGSAYDIGIPNLNGKTYKKDDMNVVILWVQIQMKATGKYYQGNNWDETGNLGDHTMQEIAKFMKARGYRNHSGKVDQTVIDELASYLGNRRKPVYVGGFYEHMNSIMRGGSTGSMTKITKSSNAKSIKWVQTCLKYLKYYSGSIDGKFSSGTINAIKKFQSKNGFVQREYVTLGVARAMLEAYYNAGGNLNNLP